MALIEKTIVDKIEVVGIYKFVQVREDKQIVDDATDVVKVNGQWHRYVLSPGDDLSGQPADVVAVANAVSDSAVANTRAVRLLPDPNVATASAHIAAPGSIASEPLLSFGALNWIAPRTSPSSTVVLMVSRESKQAESSPVALVPIPPFK